MFFGSRRRRASGRATCRSHAGPTSAEDGSGPPRAFPRIQPGTPRRRRITRTGPALLTQPRRLLASRPRSTRRAGGADRRFAAREGRAGPVSACLTARIPSPPASPRAPTPSRLPRQAIGARGRSRASVSRRRRPSRELERQAIERRAPRDDSGSDWGASPVPPMPPMPPAVHGRARRAGDATGRLAAAGARRSAKRKRAPPPAPPPTILRRRRTSSPSARRQDRTRDSRARRFGPAWRPDRPGRDQDHERVAGRPGPVAFGRAGVNRAAQLGGGVG